MLNFMNFTRTDLLAIFGLQNLSTSFIFELMDIVIMTLAIGYIFSGILRRPRHENYDPLKSFKAERWNLYDLKFAALAAGPAVVIHELSHKFMAMAFGAHAVLYAPYGFYLLVIILKAIGFPFLFFVGGFVVHSPLPAMQSAIVSIAGPLSNFLIWAVLKVGMHRKIIGRKYFVYAIPLSKISLFLGIFNLIPLPGFDGFNFITSLLRALFSS